MQGLIQLYGIEVEDKPGFIKIDKHKITVRVLELLIKIAENKISVKDLLVTFMDESIGGEFLKEFSEEEVVKELGFCSILMDGDYLKYIDVSLLDDNPKVRFDELFKIQSRWSEQDLEKFFEQIVHKELKLSQLTIKFCRRIKDKNGSSMFVLKNTA